MRLHADLIIAPAAGQRELNRLNADPRLHCVYHSCAGAYRRRHDEDDGAAFGSVAARVGEGEQAAVNADAVVGSDRRDIVDNRHIVDGDDVQVFARGIRQRAKAADGAVLFNGRINAEPVADGDGDARLVDCQRRNGVERKAQLLRRAFGVG